MDKVNCLVREMAAAIGSESPVTADYDDNALKVGVDLGTSNIVITVLNRQNQPVAGALQAANAVKDGIVVDYLKAVNILKELKAKVEKRLGKELYHTATAIPPGIMPGNVRVIQNVVEAAGFKVTQIIDEPVAAAKVLAIKEGAVVDIGGGTTGISILQKGEVVLSVDEPTGGTHLTLVIAGNLNIEYEEAEKYKMDTGNHSRILPIVRPVIEKMAFITLHNIEPYHVQHIYLVGGTCCMTGIEQVFAKFTGIRTIKPDNPLLVTPLGIAMSAV